MTQKHTFHCCESYIHVRIRDGGHIILVVSASLTLYSLKFSDAPGAAHKPIRIYMGGLILGVNTLYMIFCFFNSLPTNDGKCRHDLCELSISLWDFVWGF